MSKLIDVRFLECHTDVFHAGKNFGKKLAPNKLSGMKLSWDPKEKWFELTWQNRTGFIFSNNCAFFELEDDQVIDVPKNEHKTESIEGRRRAQVSTPTGHVFEGEGKGRIRQ